MAIQILGADGLTVLAVVSGSNSARVTQFDQSGNPACAIVSNGNVLNTLDDAVTINLGGQSLVAFDVESTAGTITVSFEATIGGVQWFEVFATPAGALGGIAVDSTSANGQWLAPIGGFTAVRARVSSVSGGATTVSMAVTPGGATTAALTVTGSVSISNFPAVQFVTGSVGITGITFPETVNVAGEVNIGNWPATIGISASANIPVVVQNQPATQNVSGTVNANAVIQNWPSTLGVSGSVAATIENWPATVGVSGSVSVSNFPATQGVIVQNQPLTQNVSGTVTVTQTGSFHVTVDNPTTSTATTIQNWPALIGVSGTVTSVNGPTNTYTSGLQGVSGAVSLLNWPLTMGVSASAAFPVIVQNQPLITNVSGTIFVTQTGSLHVTVDNPTTATAATIQNWPLTIGVSGSVTTSPVPTNVYTSGLQGISGAVLLSNWPASIGVSASVNLPVVVQNQPLITNVSGTVFVTQTGSLHVTVDNQTSTGATNVYTSGLQGISGGVVIQNWPSVIGVSGTFASSPVPTNVYTSGLQGVSGAVSLLNWPLTIGVSASVNLPVVVQNQPLTTNVSGTVTANAVIQNWPAVIGVSGSTVIQNWPALIGISGSTTVGAWANNVTGSVTISGSGSVGSVSVKNAGVQSVTTDLALVVALSPGSAQTRSSTPTVTTVAGTASSTTILASNTARLGAIITNSSTAILYLRYGSGAAANSAGNYTIAVPISGGSHEVPYGYTGQITGIWASANGYANITEITV